MTAADGRQVAGKVVAITGAGRGIGAATAQLLAAQGAWVVLGSRGKADLAAVASTCSRALPGWRSTLRCTR